MKDKNTTFAHGVQVGDIFQSSWGYDQTNVSFFQVISVTEKSAKVREVFPPVVALRECGPMAEDRVYDIPGNGEMLPSKEYSVFISNKEKGASKRIRVYNFHGKPEAYIKISSFASSKKIPAGEFKCYVSWYA